MYVSQGDPKLQNITQDPAHNRYLPLRCFVPGGELLRRLPAARTDHKS